MSDHHHHHTEDQTDRRLSFSIVLNGVIVVAEIIGGLLSGSIGLHHIHVWEVRPGKRFMTAHVDSIKGQIPHQPSLSCVSR